MRTHCCETGRRESFHWRKGPSRRGCRALAGLSGWSSLPEWAWARPESWRPPWRMLPQRRGSSPRRNSSTTHPAQAPPSPSRIIRYYPAVPSSRTQSGGPGWYLSPPTWTRTGSTDWANRPLPARFQRSTGRPLEGVFGDELPERQKQILGHRVRKVVTRLQVWVLRELCRVLNQSRCRIRRHVTRHFLPSAEVHICGRHAGASSVHRHERDIKALEVVLDDVEIMKGLHPEVHCTSGLGICISLCMSSHAVIVFHHNNALAQVA